MSEREKQISLAIAESHTSGTREIREAIGLKPNEFAPYRERLAKSGIIDISHISWDQELSPWAHEPIVARNDHFTGKAGEYMALMEHEILPWAESVLAWKPGKRILAGYSMAGLFQRMLRLSLTGLTEWSVRPVLYGILISRIIFARRNFEGSLKQSIFRWAIEKRRFRTRHCA